MSAGLQKQRTCSPIAVTNGLGACQVDPFSRESCPSSAKAIARILTKLLLIFCRQKFLGQVVLFHGSLQPQPSQTISRILSSATVSAIFLRLGSPLASDVAKWAACSKVTLGGMGGS